MRGWIALALVMFASPVCAQTSSGATSGATSIINSSDPPPLASTTSHLITAPTVAAPGLAAAGIETCLGSASGGLSLMGGGFTFGSTKVDQGCTIRLLARQLYAFGLHQAAVALMCQDDRVANAMTVAGSPCPVPPSPAPMAAGAPLATEDSETAVAVGLSQSAAAPSTGYILDLPPAQRYGRAHLSLAAPEASHEEQAWFDRASSVN